MQRAAIGALVALAFGCKREPPALTASLPVTGSPASSSTPAAAARPPERPSAPLVDAAVAVAYRVEHPTCGIDAINNEQGFAAIRSGVPVVCLSGDAGVAWQIGRGAPGVARLALVLAHAYQQDLALDAARMGDELRVMDAEAQQTGDHVVASVGLLFRAPKRVRGRIVRIEGTAQDVHEANGETTMAILLDGLGRERIEVVYPGIASDAVVNGVQTIAYGMSTGSHTAHSVLGDQLVPEVAAVFVGTRQEIDALERLPPPRQPRPHHM